MAFYQQPIETALIKRKINYIKSQNKQILYNKWKKSEYENKCYDCKLE